MFMAIPVLRFAPAVCKIISIMQCNSVIVLGVLLAFLPLKILCCQYSTFTNVPAKVVVKASKSKIIQVNDCIENTEETKDAFTIEISQQTLPFLLQKAVVNLNKLEHLAIEHSGIQRVEFSAFYNLPVLRNLSLNFNELEKIEAKVFEGLPLRYLDLKYNQISYIENFAFRISTLVKLRLSNNLLTSFQPDWFGKSDLLHLELDNNLIEYLPANAFVKLKKLRALSLAKNQIWSIHRNAFNNATELRILVLTCNRLKYLNENLFASVSSHVDTRGFRYLHLDGNNLTYLPKKILEKLRRSLVLLEVHHNPFECTCYWDIVNWGKRHRLRVLVDTEGENPVCVTSLKNSRECIEVIDEEVIKEYHIVSKPYTCPLRRF